MNREQLLELLMKLLRDFICHPSLFEDILDILENSGNESGFLTILSTRLNFLRRNGVLSTRHKEFEPLKEADGLYSMHISNTGFNIRIVYAFTPYRVPALLLAFYERGGKKRTDYSRYVQPSQNRFKEVLEKYG